MEHVCAWDPLCWRRKLPPGVEYFATMNKDNLQILVSETKQRMYLYNGLWLILMKLDASCLHLVTLNRLWLFALDLFKFVIACCTYTSISCTGSVVLNKFGIDQFNLLYMEPIYDFAHLPQDLSLKAYSWFGWSSLSWQHCFRQLWVKLKYCFHVLVHETETEAYTFWIENISIK